MFVDFFNSDHSLAPPQHVTTYLTNIHSSSYVNPLLISLESTQAWRPWRISRTISTAWRNGSSRSIPPSNSLRANTWRTPINSSLPDRSINGSIYLSNDVNYLPTNTLTRTNSPSHINQLPTYEHDVFALQPPSSVPSRFHLFARTTTTLFFPSVSSWCPNDLLYIFPQDVFYYYKQLPPALSLLSLHRFDSLSGRSDDDELSVY